MTKWTFSYVVTAGTSGEPTLEFERLAREHDPVVTQSHHPYSTFKRNKENKLFTICDRVSNCLEFLIVYVSD